MQTKILTSDSQGTDCVFIDCEAFFYSMSSHILIENITPSEIEDTTVILILGYQPTNNKQFTNLLLHISNLAKIGLLKSLRHKTSLCGPITEEDTIIK